MQNTKIVLFASLAFLAIASFIACTKNEYFRQVKGYAPIYDGIVEAQIQSMPPANYSKQPGKIYQHNSITYQIENGKGIHVIDCSNLAQPKKISLIKIKGVTEMAIKDNILYADNYNDLVAINISDLRNVKEVDRVKNAYNLSEFEVPPVANTYFECVDVTKGNVLGWEEKELLNPKCKTN